MKQIYDTKHKNGNIEISNYNCEGWDKQISIHTPNQTINVDIDNEGNVLLDITQHRQNKEKITIQNNRIETLNETTNMRRVKLNSDKLRIRIYKFISKI